MLEVEQKVGIGSCFPVTVGRRPDKPHRRGAGEDRAGRTGPSTGYVLYECTLLATWVWWCEFLVWCCVCCSEFYDQRGTSMATT